MPVNKDESGRHWVQAEAEVPGTPEEVWAAIATGPGISSWFVPSEVEERVGGTATSSFGPGMDSAAKITEWDPPHKWANESRDDMGPDDPTVATEWIVESRGGGTCVVRVVHSWFTDKDTWDEQYEGTSYGWLAFFRVLRLYMAHFTGQQGAIAQVMGAAPEPKETAWEALTDGLGVTRARIGQRVETFAGAPTMGGTVEGIGQEGWPELLITLDKPFPGIAHLAPHAMMGQVFLAVRLFSYGEGAGEKVKEQEAVWQEWLNAKFAPVEMPG